MELSRIATILANWNAYNDLIYKGKMMQLLDFSPKAERLAETL